MAIAIALVLIFTLYLIDKHGRWRQALKLTIGLTVLGIVGVGGFFGWQKYEAWQEARQEARQEAEYEAEQAKQAAQKQTELAKTCREWEDKHPLGSPPDKMFTDQGGLTEKLTEKHYWVLGPPQGCEGPLETDYNTRNVWVLVPANPSKPKAKLKTGSQQQIDWSKYATPPNCEAVPCSDWGVVTGEFGSAIENSNCFDTDLHSAVRCEKIAVLKKGDRVQILAEKMRAPDGLDIHKVKFQQWTGWVNAADLSPEIAKP
jgi:hypothetical protein